MGAVINQDIKDMDDAVGLLAGKIDDRDFKVGVIGMGYVGLPLALEFAGAGFQVTGFDVAVDKVEELNRGKSYIRHIESGRVEKALKKGFSATVDFGPGRDCDALIMCVPTPLTSHREPDMTYIRNTCRQISPVLRDDHLVILESTTYPGTTMEVVKPILDESGLIAGQDYYLAYSPEREDPNNQDYSTSTIPKVVGGISQPSLDLACRLYGQVVSGVVPVSSMEVAEATKILENTFRAVNIALVNELKMIFDRLGIDVWEVIDAAATKPFGFMKFTPGPGLGGHCIPIDPFYLSWKAREVDMPTRFIEMAGEINTSMPYHVVSKLSDALSDRGKGLKGAKILIAGLAYKKNVDDMRESPSLKLMEILESKNAVVDYHDPHIPAMPHIRNYPKYEGRKSVDIKTVKEYDAVLVATDHDDVDWEYIFKNAALVVDTRGVYRKSAPNLVKA